MFFIGGNGSTLMPTGQEPQSVLSEVMAMFFRREMADREEELGLELVPNKLKECYPPKWTQKLLHPLYYEKFKGTATSSELQGQGSEVIKRELLITGQLLHFSHSPLRGGGDYKGKVPPMYARLDGKLLCVGRDFLQMCAGLKQPMVVAPSKASIELRAANETVGYHDYTRNGQFTMGPIELGQHRDILDKEAGFYLLVRHNCNGNETEVAHIEMNVFKGREARPYRMWGVGNTLLMTGNDEHLNEVWGEKEAKRVEEQGEAAANPWSVNGLCVNGKFPFWGTG